MPNINIPPTTVEQNALAASPESILGPEAFASSSITSIATMLTPAIGALATLGIVGLGMKAIITGRNPLKAEKEG